MYNSQLLETTYIILRDLYGWSIFVSTALKLCVLLKLNPLIYQ